MIKTKIKNVFAREILDSRGNPTVEARVMTESGATGIFGVPSGASTGAHEALELRDGDTDRFGGKGVLKAVANVNGPINDALAGMDASDQRALDDKLLELDGTANKSKLGGNAILGASIAAAKAAAAAEGKEVYEHLRGLADIKQDRPVPYLFMNLVNGGLHAQSRLAFQEYLIIPQTDDIEESLNIGTIVMHELKKRIREALGPSSSNLGDEGGFAPDTQDARLPLQLLWESVTCHGFENKVKLAMDVAASSFYKPAGRTGGDGKYAVGGKELSAGELADMYRGWEKEFPILSIEDPFTEEAFDDFASLNADGRFTVIGDDLTVTNTKRLQTAIEKKSVSGIIIKLNQVGTLSEALDTMKLAAQNGIRNFIKHRSGETNDDFIADLAYAFGTYGLMTGAPQRGERVSKYNRLLKITAK